KSYKGQKRGQNVFALDIKSACNPLSYLITGAYFTIMERKTGFTVFTFIGVFSHYIVLLILENTI
ncbi:hypothetical protein LI142_23400, partial [Eubacterium limosum]|uniref:hypothetical protein n=1 Tax=Eubacterium limosum TaxID=1736 RepID=UPI001D06994F